MKKLLFTILTVLVVYCPVSAQNALLKKLGDKAKNTVEKKLEQKVEKSVSDKMDQVLGLDGKPAATSTSASAKSPGFAESLLTKDAGSGVWAPYIETSTLSFKGYEEAVAARPAWPSDKDLSDREALKKYATEFENYLVAVQALCSEYSQLSSTLYDQSFGSGGSDTRCNAIYEELSGIYAKKIEEASNEAYNNLTAAPSMLLGNKSAVNTGTLGGALFSLANQIVRSWPSSQECRKVNSIEADNPKKAGKQEQNKVINAWNAEQLSKWESTLRSFDDKDAVAARRIAELDAELDSMGDAVKKTSSWAMAKSQAGTLNGIVLDYARMPKRILDCPLVSNVWED